MNKQINKCYALISFKTNKHIQFNNCFTFETKLKQRSYNLIMRVYYKLNKFFYFIIRGTGNIQQKQ